MKEEMLKNVHSQPVFVMDATEWIEGVMNQPWSATSFFSTVVEPKVTSIRSGAWKKALEKDVFPIVQRIFMSNGQLLDALDIVQGPMTTTDTGAAVKKVVQEVCGKLQDDDLRSSLRRKLEEMCSPAAIDRLHDFNGSVNTDASHASDAMKSLRDNLKDPGSRVLTLAAGLSLCTETAVKERIDASLAGLQGGDQRCISLLVKGSRKLNYALSAPSHDSVRRLLLELLIPDLAWYNASLGVVAMAKTHLLKCLETMTEEAQECAKKDVFGPLNMGAGADGAVELLLRNVEFAYGNHLNAGWRKTHNWLHNELDQLRVDAVRNELREAVFGAKFKEAYKAERVVDDPAGAKTKNQARLAMLAACCRDAASQLVDKLLGRIELLWNQAQRAWLKIWENAYGAIKAISEGVKNGDWEGVKQSLEVTTARMLYRTCADVLCALEEHGLVPPCKTPYQIDAQQQLLSAARAVVSSSDRAETNLRSVKVLLPILMNDDAGGSGSSRGGGPAASPRIASDDDEWRCFICECGRGNRPGVGFKASNRLKLERRRMLQALLAARTLCRQCRDLLTKKLGKFTGDLDRAALIKVLDSVFHGRKCKRDDAREPSSRIPVKQL